MHIFFGALAGIFERIIGVLIVAFVVFALGAIALVGYGIYHAFAVSGQEGGGMIFIGVLVLGCLIMAVLGLDDDDD